MISKKDNSDEVNMYEEVTLWKVTVFTTYMEKFHWVAAGDLVGE